MKYLIGALVILALLFLAWWLISRGKQRHLDEQRAEAARIRAGAQERSAVLQGQETFAQQSTERAGLARREAEERARQAEESAREAQRVEEEARRHQADLERGRLERDAELRRADELDPDVELAKDDPRPLPEDLDDDVRPIEETRVHTPVPAEAPATSAVTSTGAHADSETVADSVTPADSQEQGRTEHGWGTGAAAAGAGAAAAGSAYAATRGNEPDDASARLASGVDFSDDEPATREWAPVDSSRDADQASDSVSDGVQGDERAEETTMSDEELFGAKAVSNDAAEAGRTNEERDLRDGEARADGVADGTSDADTTDDGPAEVTIIGDVEDYASTEPLPADEQTPGTSPEGVEGARRDADLAGDSPDEEPTHEETWEDDTPNRSDVGSARDSDAADNGSHDSDARTTGDWGGATATATGDATGDVTTTGSHAATDGDQSSDRDEWTDPGRDSARDADRGDADVAGAADVDRGQDVTSDAGSEPTSDDATSEGGDASHWPDGTDRINTVDDDNDAGSDQGGAHTEDADADGAGSEGGGSSRRISAVEEIRDGGFGVGSAAPFEDRAQPLDHPVQAYRDTMTYRAPGAQGYDSAEPDVWFYDEDAARRAGFNPSQG